MATTPTFNDGSLSYGTRTESVTPKGGGNAAVYVFENLTLNRPITVIETFDETGGPLRAAGVPKFVTGTATVQNPLTSTRVLQSGDTFSDTFDVGNALGAENFIIQDVVQAEGQMEPRKFNITFRKKYN